jgi:hypothetical protein
MSVRIKYDIVPEFVKPKLDDLDVPTITLEEYTLKPSPQIASTIKPPITKAQDAGGAGGASGDNWYNWTISLTLDGLDTTVKGSEKFFKTLDKITTTITQLLKVIRLLSGNVNSTSTFLKFAIKQLAKEIKEFVDSLTSTGIYSSFIIPDFDKSFPKYSVPIFGGYQEFISRVNATCLSSTDPDAPKFEDADKVGGVIIAMLGGVDDPDFLRNLMDNFKKLSNLFGFQIPYPSPAQKFKATPGFYSKKGKMTLGVKLTWEAPESPVGSFFVYRKPKSPPVPMRYVIDGVNVDVDIFTKSEPIAKIKANPLKPNFSYIDFDVKPETVNLYKVYSVFGDDYLDNNPYLKSVSSPVATPVVVAHVPRECIPLSELTKYTNLSMSGELLSPIDLEGDWQSVTVRRMLGNQIDSMYSNLDALADKLIGLVDTGSDAMSAYLKFYGERVESLLEIIEKIKNITVRLSSFTQRGTFMVLNLPLEQGGMRGFVDRFNKACNSGTSSNGTPKNSKDLASAGVQKNAPIARFNERGIMFGVVLLYGIPDLSNPDRLKDIVPEYKIKSMKKQYENSGKAISTLLTMLGLG